jgi:PAS domain S-box-containing protein
MSPNVTFLLNITENRLSIVGQKSKQILGYPVAYIQGMASEMLFGLMHPDDAARLPDLFSRWNTAADNDVYVAEYRVKDASGDWRWIMTRATVFSRDTEGHVKEVIGASNDITKQKQMEDRLRHMQRMETVGQLAGGVAHDFNNLLTPILGYSELILLELSEEDPKYKEIKVIREAAQKAKHLTQQLLSFSRKQVLEMQPVDLNQVITGFEKILKRTIREDTEILFNLQPGLHSILGDISQIGQILMNLSVNAQDALPNGGTIMIETSNILVDDLYAQLNPDVTEGDYVKLELTDNGMGMSDEVRKHIFEPFFTTKDEGKGTGLGLATVYGIVKQHNGYIEVYSETGHGTTFKIYFPVIDAKVLQPAERSADQRRNGGEQVIVVEDNEMARHLVCNILKQHGYAVLEFAGSQACVDYFEESRASAHLLLSDIIMPEMNGKVLYQKLNKLNSDLKVIYMSGYPDDVIAHHGILESGMHFIQKPFSVNALLDKINEALSH